MQSIFFHMYRKNVILHQNLDSVKSKLLCIYENYYRFSSMSSVEMVLGENDEFFFFVLFKTELNFSFN